MIYVPYGSLLFAFVLIYAPRFVVSREMKAQAGGYDNKDPRGQQARLEGRGKRAVAAHLNSFEAFAPFAAAVLAAGQRGVSLTVMAILCGLFCAVRTVYIVAYIADNAKLRSGMWALGMVCITALFVCAIAGA